MKKVKIMLMSLLLLAVVGGALAFKAKFQTSFCYTNAIHDEIKDTWYCPDAADLDPGDCPQVDNSTTINGFAGTTTSCTTTRPAGGCGQVVNCTFVRVLKNDLP